MKKDENSGVSIKQIMITTLFLTIATFGGLNAYRIVCVDDVNTIQKIESANLESNENIEFETALVENTENDIYSEEIKFLGVKTVESDKVVSRGIYERGQNTEKTVLSSGETVNKNKLLNAVINEIKELGEKQESIIDNIDDLNSKSGEAIEIENDINNSGNIIETDKLITEEVIETTAEAKEELQPLTPPTEYIKTIDVKATAYCLCKKCCGKSPSNPNYGVTASGFRIIPGQGMKIVASDPKVIPLGTKVYIEGLYGAKDYGYATVADTGSAIKNLKIDLYMDTHQMALNWGVKTVRVYILDK